MLVYFCPGFLVTLFLFMQSFNAAAMEEDLLTQDIARENSNWIGFFRLTNGDVIEHTPTCIKAYRQSQTLSGPIVFIETCKAPELEIKNQKNPEQKIILTVQQTSESIKNNLISIDHYAETIEIFPTKDLINEPSDWTGRYKLTNGHIIEHTPNGIRCLFVQATPMGAMSQELCPLQEKFILPPQNSQANFVILWTNCLPRKFTEVLIASGCYADTIFEIRPEEYI